MHQLAYFVFLLLFLKVVTPSLLLEDSIIEADRDGRFSFESVERSLAMIVPCNGGGGKQNYFNIEIKVLRQEGFTPYNCTRASSLQVGIQINAILLDYGVGAAGVGDNAAFIALVCPKPARSIRRRLAAKGFVWMGSGACRYCKGDDFDKRGLQQNDPNWFTNIYAPVLEDTLRNALVNTLLSKFIPCFGNAPQVIVDVQEVPKSQALNWCIMR